MPRAGRRSVLLACAVAAAGVAVVAQGGPLWVDATADLLPVTASWTNKVEIADLNGDGRPDVVVSGKTGTWILFNEGFKQKEGNK